MDIVDEIDQFLLRKAIEGPEDTLTSRTLLMDAAEEIEHLRSVLQKISNLGSNAPDGSTLEECSILATSALMREV